MHLTFPENFKKNYKEEKFGFQKWQISCSGGNLFSLLINILSAILSGAAIFFEKSNAIVILHVKVKKDSFVIFTCHFWPFFTIFGHFF